MATPITILCSMATRHMLDELSQGFQTDIEAMGGVDAAKKIRAGESPDLVVLGDEVIAALEKDGHLLAGSRAALVTSQMALAVRTGQPHPDLGSAISVKTALLNAKTVGYSTGPSGLHLIKLFKSWGLDAAAEPTRFVQAKPGIPVASLVASGQVEIGIQQLSELLGTPGIDIVGLVPPPIQTVTTFSAGIGAKSANMDAARRLIAQFNAPGAAATKRKFGLEPA